MILAAGRAWSQPNLRILVRLKSYSIHFRESVDWTKKYFTADIWVNTLTAFFHMSKVAQVLLKIMQLLANCL